MQNNKPTFRSVFKTTWDDLPPVFQKRYANRPYSNDLATVEGKMEVSFSRLMSCMMPILRLMHILAPYQGKDIAVKVDFRSTADSDATCLDRKFYFPGKQPYEFNSRVQPIKDSEAIEYMSFGIGWKIHYFYDGVKVIMKHKGYVLKLFGYNIPLPLGLLIGSGYTEETVLDENSYRVAMTISHPLFGALYSYAGDFTFTRLIS
jgi:hypothetical protein